MNWRCRLGWHRRSVEVESRWVLGRMEDADRYEAQLWSFWRCERCHRWMDAKDSGKRWRIDVRSKDE